MLASACSAPQTPAAIPDTPAGSVFHAWLDAYNTADSARMLAYVRGYEPTMSVHTQMEFRRQTGRYAVVSVERTEARHLEVVLRAGSESSVARGLTMYSTVDLNDGSPLRATTAFTLLEKGSPTSAVAALAKRSGTSLPRMSAAQRAAAVDSLAAKIERTYVHADLAHGVADSLRARLARKAYESYASEVSLAHRLTTDLRELTTDPQLSVEYAFTIPLPLPAPAPPALLHCGLEPVKAFENGVWHVNVQGFGNPDPTCGHEVSEAMNAVAGGRALIVDLREAVGDSRSDMAYLASYLVGSCTHLGALWQRRTGNTLPIHTHDGLPGPAFGGSKPLVILTSRHTLAAAEELAYDLQSLRRAVIVGEPTGGSASVAALGQIGEHLLVRIPIARAVNPITKTSWQGVGVQPDIRVTAEDAMATARRLLRDGRVPRGQHATIAAAGSPAQPSGTATKAGQSMPGVRFVIDTIVSPTTVWQGPLSRVAGVIEFASGRGRLDVTAIRHGPTISIGDIIVDEPLAKPGDYYLFDNQGFILVRPATHGFSSFVFTRADFNQTGALLPGAFMMWSTPVALDTPSADNVAARRQHAPVSIHWHMQPRDFERTGVLYARGWLEIEDAPAIEAGVARWFEVAAALATGPRDVNALARDGLTVTSITLLRRPGAQRPSVTYSETLTPRQLTAGSIDRNRLLLPSAYTETAWLGDSPEHTRIHSTIAHWQTHEDTTTQRARAACRQAWVPEE